MRLKTASISFLLLTSVTLGLVTPVWYSPPVAVAQEVKKAADVKKAVGDDPTPTPDPVASVQLPTQVSIDTMFLVDFKGSVGTKRVWQFKPSLPAGSIVRRSVDADTGETYLACQVKGPPQKYLFVFVTTSDGNPKVAVATEYLTVGGQTPTPVPPGPTPDPKPPGPTPSPAPIPVDGLRVLIIYESGDATTLTPGQNSAIYGLTVRNYLEAHCAQEEGGHKAYRIYDKDVDAKAEPIWDAAMKRPRKKADGTPDPTLPWVIISNGKTGYEGPLPKTVNEFMELLKRYET